MKTTEDNCHIPTASKKLCRDDCLRKSICSVAILMNLLVSPAFAEDYLELTKRQTKDIPTSKLIEMARNSPSSFLPMILHQRIESSSASELRQILGHQFLYGYYYQIFFRLVYVLKAQNPLNEFPTSELTAYLNQSTFGDDAYREYSTALNGRLSALSDSQLKATMMNASPGSNFSKLCYIHVSTREERRSAPVITKSEPKRTDEPTEYMKTTYSNLMRRRISRFWFPPKGCEQLQITVYFIIHNDGHISDLRVTKSSGVEAADRAACIAVTNAAPFQALPQESADDNCQVIHTFDNGPGMRRF